MTDSFVDATLEISAVNGGAVFVVFTTAKWGEYLGEPGNVISLIVSIGAMVFTVVRTRYYIQQKRYAREDREEAKRLKNQQP